MERAAGNLVRYIADAAPRAVVIVMGTSLKSPDDRLSACIRWPSHVTNVTFLYGGLQWAHRVAAGEVTCYERGGPLEVSKDWRIIALDPGGAPQYVGAQGIRLARLLGCNVICSGSPSTSLIHETIEGASRSGDVWAVELGSPASNQHRRDVAFAILTHGVHADAPQVVVISPSGSFKIGGVEYS
jgi:hypothetical protein